LKVSFLVLKSEVFCVIPLKWEQMRATLSSKDHSVCIHSVLSFWCDLLQLSTVTMTINSGSIIKLIGLNSEDNGNRVNANNLNIEHFFYWSSSSSKSTNSRSYTSADRIG
jgi:hypothetical protein